MTHIPRHIGFILDGNRRWAREHGLPTYEGHLAGLNALEDVLRASVDAGVEYISFYTWSTENWNRAESEVSAMMKLIRRVFKRELKELIKAGCRLVVVGEKTHLPDDIIRMIQDAEASSRDGDKATLVMCFNYGGQQEIVRATLRMMEEGLAPPLDDRNESDHQTPPPKDTAYAVLKRAYERGDSAAAAELFAQYLDHPDVPPCDLIVRTSGEQRLSNFMLWRSAYSEFLFLDKYWPDMTPADVGAILDEYTKRNRRHGA